MKFDVIVGNPPYQSGKGSGNYTLWPKFIIVANKLLVDNGYLSFVVPQTWAANQRTSNEWIRDVSALRYHTLSSGHLITADFTISEHIDVAISLSHLLWQKSSSGTTTVNTDKGCYSIDYDTTPWLPVIGGQVGIDILNKTIWNPTCKFETLLNNGRETGGFREGHRNISNILTTSNIWPIVNTSAQYTRGIYLYSRLAHPHQLSEKVIFSASGYSAPFYDSGVYGLGHHARGVSVSSKEHGEIVMRVINSKLMKFVAATKSSSGGITGIAKVQDHIPKLPSVMTDIQIYHYFGLSQHEINYLDTF